MLPSFAIMDNFLSDPLAVREQALKLNYDPAYKKGNYPGLDSTTPLQTQGLNAAVSKFAGVELVAAPNTSHGHCRVTLAGDRGISGVHVDPAFYSGILYLSLNEHCRGGTDFFRHRRTGLEKVPSNQMELLQSGYSDPNTLIEDVINKDSTKPGKWERIMRAPMRFNRLILFNPMMFHTAAPGFGRDPKTGRLVCVLFFARKK
jgi:hypothetical protein